MDLDSFTDLLMNFEFQKVGVGYDLIRNSTAHFQESRFLTVVFFVFFLFIPRVNPKGYDFPQLICLENNSHHSGNGKSGFS